MNEPTRTLLGDLAIAGGCAIAVGALVACACYPLVCWWADRREGRAGDPLPSAPDAVGGEGSTTALAPEIDFAASVERLIGEQP